MSAHLPPSRDAIVEIDRQARWSARVCFFVFGVLVETLFSRLPLIKHDLGLSAAQLSLALVAAPIGAIASMPVVPRLIERLTSARVVRLAVIADAAATALLALAWNLGSLAALMLLLGLSVGALDTAVNTQGVAIERVHGRPLMAGFHGCYSLGVMSGGLVGSIAAATGFGPPAHFLFVGLAVSLVAIFGSRGLLPGDVDAALDVKPPPVSSRKHRLLDHPRLIWVGLIAFCAFFAEGSVDNWSSVFLHDVRGASFSVAPLGASACGAAMAIGRLSGDRVILRLGRRRSLVCGAVLGCAALLMAVVVASPLVAIAGYALFGLMVATIAPIAFTLGGTISRTPPAWAISRVTTLGYLGVLLSPVAIGLVAHLTGLEVAVAIPAVVLLSVVPLSAVARGR
jgi:MFS family permease